MMTFKTFQMNPYKKGESKTKHLVVTSSLFSRGMTTMEEYEYQYCKGFCGNPWLCLHVTEEVDTGKIEAEFSINDNDDYDLRVDYKDLTPAKVHEMINYMKDCEWADTDQFISLYKLILLNV